MRTITIGKRIIPLWLIAVILVSSIVAGALGYYVLKTIIILLEVKEPIEILHYPSQLSLYPGETEEFNITVQNYASVNYSVVLNFSLDNMTYQDNYVTFSNKVYTVVPGQQNLTAWLMIKSYAPPTNASLTIEFSRITEEAVLFFDDFNDGVADGWTVQLGNFEVINGEYYTENGPGQKSITTVDGLTCTNFTVEVNLRCLYAFQAAIVFRYIDNEHHYTFSLNAEGDCVSFEKYTPSEPHYGELLAVNYSVSIHLNTNYLLKVSVQGNKFTGYLNGEEVLSVTDEAYTSGQVGLRAQKANVFFDNFTVYSLP